MEILVSKQPFGIIYLTTNSLTGDRYIGQTCRSGDSRNHYLGSGIVIKNAIKKYGKENFSRTILAYCDNQAALNRLERLYIALLKPEYNIASGGQDHTTFGVRFGPDVRLRMLTANRQYEKRIRIAKALRGKKRPPSVGEKVSMYQQRPEVKEAKRKSFEANREKILKASHTIEANMKRRQTCLGRRMPMDSIIKMRLARQKASGRPVVCLETGIVYPAQSDAARATKTSQGNICQCLQGQRQTAGGYHWANVKAKDE